MGAVRVSLQEDTHKVMYGDEKSSAGLRSGNSSEKVLFPQGCDLGQIGKR